MARGKNGYLLLGCSSNGPSFCHQRGTNFVCPNQDYHDLLTDWLLIWNIDLKMERSCKAEKAFFGSHTLLYPTSLFKLQTSCSTNELFTGWLHSVGAMEKGDWKEKPSQLFSGIDILISPNSRKKLGEGVLLVRFYLTRSSKILLHAMALYHAFILSSILLFVLKEYDMRGIWCYILIYNS